MARPLANRARLRRDFHGKVSSNQPSPVGIGQEYTKHQEDISHLIEQDTDHRRRLPGGRNGFGSHTFSLWNDSGERFWVKWHLKTKQGIECMSAQEAARVVGENPDYHRQDLHGAIERGDHPKWTVKIQVMPETDEEGYHLNPFDLIKVWPYADYPLMEVGVLEISRNRSSLYPAVDFFYLDVFSYFDDVVANPSAYGLTNVTDSAFDGSGNDSDVEAVVDNSAWAWQRPAQLYRAHSGDGSQFQCTFIDLFLVGGGHGVFKPREHHVVHGA